jgi:hypothetical protein
MYSELYTQQKATLEAQGGEVAANREHYVTVTYNALMTGRIRL